MSKFIYIVVDDNKEVIRIFSTIEKIKFFIKDLFSQQENVSKQYYIQEAEIDWIERPVTICSFVKVNNQIVEKKKMVKTDEYFLTDLVDNLKFNKSDKEFQEWLDSLSWETNNWQEQSEDYLWQQSVDDRIVFNCNRVKLLIEKLAYSLWEYEGHPHGRDVEHWISVEREVWSNS